MLFPRGYGIVCMLVAHNTCTIHTETSTPVVCAVNYTCILCSTCRIVHSTGLVLMVMLLELKNFWRWVPTSTTIIVIINKWVIVPTHTHPLVVACVVYQYSVYWYRLSEITLVHSRLICGFISHWSHTSKAPPVKNILYMPWELIYPFNVRYMPWACNQHINTLYSGYYTSVAMVFNISSRVFRQKVANIVPIYYFWPSFKA